MRLFLLQILIMSQAGAWSTAHAHVWKHVDEQGVIQYSNQPTARSRLVFSNGAPVSVAWSELADERYVRRAVLELTRKPSYRQLEPLLTASADGAGLDQRLVKALVMAESGFDPHAVSPKGAVGLMQVMPATAQRYGLPYGVDAVAKQLKQPDLNLRVGTRYLADLMRLYPDRLDLVLAAYNAGEGAVRNAGYRVPDYPETQQYVRRVMAYYRLL